MNVSLIVDWLSVTLKQWPGAWPFFSLDTAEQVTPRYGYKTAWKDLNDAVAYQGGNADSIHLVFSGNALNNLRGDGVSIQDMLRKFHDVHAKVTRLDIAADWRDPGVDVVGLRDIIASGNATLNVKRWSFLESENKGQTLYIGSRASERMLRIYNKRAELARKAVDVDVEWIRVEAELKDDQATNAAKAIMDNSIGSVLAAHITRCIAFPWCKPWLALIGALPAPSHIMPSTVGKSNTDQWLMEVVAPILRKRLSDPDFEAAWSVFMSAN
jgi:hypothetical protein